MPTPTDKHFYNKAKSIADSIYKKPSAYKSGCLAQKSKEMVRIYVYI